MNGRDGARGAVIARAIPNFVLALLGLVCAAGLWRIVATIGLRVPFDFNEGWNAYHTAAAMTGRALYPDAHAYLVNNYPPLSFYVMGALAGVVGDNIVAGRIISLVSFLAVAGAVWRSARIMDADCSGSAIAALYFMAALIVGSDYVGMDDPQLLGHALEMTGLLLVLRAPERAIPAAFVFGVALFVKHNLVSLPLALAVWLFVYYRHAAIRFVVAGTAFAAAGLLAFRWTFGSDLLAHLASARTYSLSLLATSTGDWLIWGAIPAAIVASVVVLARKDKIVVLCGLYTAIAIVFGVAFSGGAGVDANVFFDADIALALGVALAFTRLAERNAWWPAGIAAALLLPVLGGLYLASDAEWRDSEFWLHPMADEAALAQSDERFLAAHRGRALCETLAFCYWAGKPAEVDVFNTEQEFATGKRSDDDLVRQIETHAFAAIEFDTLEPFGLTPRVRAALLRAYRIDHSNDDGVFFLPR